MAEKLGEAVLELRTDDRKLGAGIAKGKRDAEGLAKSFEAAGKRMQNAGAKLSLALTLPLAAFGIAAFKAATDAAELESMFDVTFGDMSAAVRKWAEETGDAMGRSTGEMMAMAASYQDILKKQMDPAAAAEMSKQLTVLTQDLASFKNLSNDVAKQKIFSGLIGEAEPLRAVGVLLSETAVAAKAMQMGLAASSKALTDGDKVRARAALIMEQLADAQGDVIRTFDSTANQLKRANAEWQEMQVQIGTKLLPVITPLIAKIGDLLGWFTSLPDGVQTASLAIAGFAALLGPVLFAIGSVARGVALLIPLLVKVAPGALAASRALMLLALSPAGLVIMAIAVALVALQKVTYRAAQANEVLEKRAQAAESALDEQRTVTEQLTTATGEARKAILAKAAADLVEARNAMAAARANLIAAQAARERQLAIASAAREQARGLSARDGGSAAREEAARRAAHADANLAAAIREGKARNAVVAEILKQLTAPAPKFDVGGADPAKKTKKGAADQTEQLAKERLRLQHDMEQETLDGQRELLQAQSDLAGAYAERAGLARQMLDIEHQQREKTIAFDLATIEADKTISAEQKQEARARAEKQRILNDQLLPLRKQLINDEEELERQRRIEQDRELRFNIQRGLLEAQRNLATTAAERRAIELQILDLAYREHRERLERIIREGKDADERHRAQLELNNLARQFALDRQGVVAATRNPLEQWAASVPKTAAEITEALQGIQANALDRLADGITDLITGTKSLGDAFGDIARSIIADIIQMTVRMLIFRAVSGMFGSAGGGAAHSLGGGLFAKGGVFSGGKLTPFASGGIVNGPTLFPMRNGMGLMGEAGPEAVMPLARDSQGRLGVRSSGASGGPIEVIVTVEASDDLMVKAAVVADSRIQAAEPRITRNSVNATVRTLKRPTLMGRR